MNHDHCRPDVGTQRAVLSVARAALADEPKQAAADAEAAPCQPCAIIAAVQLGFAVAAQAAGETGLISEAFRKRLAAMLAEAEGELRGSAN